MSSLPLKDVRQAVADALAPVEAGDPPLISELPDAVEPPALMFLWDAPMIRPLTGRPMVGGSTCQLEGSFVVRCVAARYEPGAAVYLLEGMLDRVLASLEIAGGSWLFQSAVPPRGVAIAGVPYLCADALYRVPVSLNGGP